MAEGSAATPASGLGPQGDPVNKGPTGRVGPDVPGDRGQNRMAGRKKPQPGETAGVIVALRAPRGKRDGRAHAQHVHLDKLRLRLPSDLFP